jgi:membrane-bound serine protease (ClpP class)
VTIILLLIIAQILTVPSLTYAEAERDKILIVPLDSEITYATTQMIEDAMNYAQTLKAKMVIFETNTPGGEVNAVKQIMEIFTSSTIPVCVFVYPMGSVAWSGGTYLLMASHIATMASGTSIGSAQPILSTGELINDTKHINALTALMVNHARLHDRNFTAARSFIIENLNLGPEEALRYHVTELVADNVPNLLDKLSEMILIKIESEFGTSIWKLVQNSELDKYTASVSIFFTNIEEAEILSYKSGIQTGFLQIVFNPLVSSLMLTIGFLMFLVGIQTPGLGLEFVGGILLLLSLLSFGVLGLEPTILILFVIGFTLIVSELKTHIGFLGLAGATCIILGSFLLFPSPQWLLAPEVSMRIRNILVGSSVILCVFFGFLVYKVAEAKSMKVQTGPDVILSLEGVASTQLDPYGEVRIGGEFWKARTEEGIVETGTKVKIVGRDGLLLIVKKVSDANLAQPVSLYKKR